MLRAVLIVTALAASTLANAAPASAGWKTDRALALARIVWHNPCVDRMRLDWVPQTTLDSQTGVTGVVAAADPPLCEVELSLDQPLIWDSFCAVVLHEGGHLAGFRDPLNPDDPEHSHNPKSIMYVGPTHPDASKPTILFEPDEPRCHDNGRPFLEAHGALSPR